MCLYPAVCCGALICIPQSDVAEVIIEEFRMMFRELGGRSRNPVLDIMYWRLTSGYKSTHRNRLLDISKHATIACEIHINGNSKGIIKTDEDVSGRQIRMPTSAHYV